jgi:hypothetical protein
LLANALIQTLLRGMPHRVRQQAGSHGMSSGCSNWHAKKRATEVAQNALRAHFMKTQRLPRRVESFEINSPTPE